MLWVTLDAQNNTIRNVQATIPLVTLSPASLLFERSNSIKAVSLPSSDGMVPVRRKVSNARRRDGLRTQQSREMDKHLSGRHSSGIHALANKQSLRNLADVRNHTGTVPAPVVSWNSLLGQLSFGEKSSRWLRMVKPKPDDEPFG